jgi:translin
MDDFPPETRDARTRKIRRIGDTAQDTFAARHEAREQAFKRSRDVIRYSANSIRATHRGELDEARGRLGDAKQLVQEMDRVLEGHPAVFYAGFVEDAQKEYAEASATLAFAGGTQLPGPDDLGVGPAPYLNGLAESVGELRRFILDGLRRDDFSRSEELLDLMDEVYSVLVSMDFPEAVTRGLRRSTDMVRGVLERTRGDLTVALRQQRLEQRLADLQSGIEGVKSDDS